MRVCGILCARLYIFKRFQPKSWEIVLIMIYIINWWRLRFSIRIVCMYTAHCAGDSMQQKCNCRCVHVFMVFKIKIYKNKIYSAGSYNRWAKCGMNTAWKTIFNSECLYRHCSHLENGKKMNWNKFSSKIYTWIGACACMQWARSIYSLILAALFFEHSH